MPHLPHDRPSSPAFARSISATSVPLAANASRPLVDMSGSVPLPKPLKAFPPFHEMRTALRALAASEKTTKPAQQDTSACLGFPAYKMDTVTQPLPSMVTVAATGEIASEFMLAKPTTANDEPGSDEGGFETLQRAIDILAQGLGLQRISPQERASESFAGTTSTSFAPLRDGHLLLTWTDAHARDLSMEDLSEMVAVRTTVEAVLHDGVSALATERDIRQTAAELERWLRRDIPLLFTALSHAGLLRNETAREIGAENATSQLVAKRLSIILKSLEGMLRTVMNNGAGRAAIATTVAQFYVALATPVIAFAAATPLPAEKESGDTQGPLIAIPAASQAASKPANSSLDALTVLRALVARNAFAATDRDIALLSADMGRLLSHHRRGLRLLRETRGFLSAVRLTESNAQRRQPLGVLLESGRQSASAIAVSGQSALIGMLTIVGTSGGAVLDRFAQAAERKGSQSLADLISSLSDTAEGEVLEEPMTNLDSAALSSIVSETRSAARLLRAMLFRETAAADRLAARIDAFENGRYSLVR